VTDPVAERYLRLGLPPVEPRTLVASAEELLDELGDASQ
jgi:hypothetical protein